MEVERDVDGAGGGTARAAFAFSRGDGGARGGPHGRPVWQDSSSSRRLAAVAAAAARGRESWRRSWPRPGGAGPPQFLRVELFPPAAAPLLPRQGLLAGLSVLRVPRALQGERVVAAVPHRRQGDPPRRGADGPHLPQPHRRPVARQQHSHDPVAGNPAHAGHAELERRHRALAARHRQGREDQAEREDGQVRGDPLGV
ncbi:hypothetical protein VTK73DRAFT_10101 [Phialemonium thermophilum]|uniref:Uncharacterized protein n=1 Tax=Phialemonium thermophilum TaxID=223376 RepID=A0ABR3VYJ7_9PEZI